MDHLLKEEWERRVEIRQVQIELLGELAGRGPGGRPAKDHEARLGKAPA